MNIEFDPVKRDATIAARNLDFARASEVLAGPTFTMLDDRAQYGEDRWIAAGLPEGRMVVVVWSSRGPNRRIVSMRKADDREQARYGSSLAGP